MSDSPVHGEDEDIFQKIFEFAGVGIYQTSPDGRYIRVNQTLADMNRCVTPQELIDSVKDVSRQVYVDPSTRPRFLALMERDGYVRNFIVRYRRSDGTESWASEAAMPVRDANGNIEYFVGTSVDIGELVRLQEALDEAEGTYRDIFENANIGIYRSSPEGLQLRANPALVRLNGYDEEREQLAAVNDIGREWYVDPNRRDEFKKILDQNDRVENFESEIYAHKSRKRLWISENAWVVRDENGQILYYEGTVQDISEPKLAEQELEEARRAVEASSHAKSEFLANMSHELRTPLNAVIGFSDIMLREMFGPIGTERYRGYLRDINDSAHLLLRLIEDILDVAKAESGRMEIEEEIIDLFDIATDSIRLIALRAEANQVVVVNELEEGRIRLLADARRFRQIALNLVSNAVKFSNKNGQVMINAEIDESGCACFTVRDNGIGIDEEDIPLAFEPFVQLAGPGRASEGTGLGLSLTRTFAELHGGALELQSKPGEGTTVTVRIPAHRVVL
jgi:PAS domain S-box-containing protein